MNHLVRWTKPTLFFSSLPSDPLPSTRKPTTARAAIAAFSIALLAASGTVSAADISLPSQLAWTAYGTGSAGYNQSVAIGAALKNSIGVNLRVLPGKNDVARTEPLRQGKVQFSATGVGAVSYTHLTLPTKA